VFGGALRAEIIALAARVHDCELKLSTSSSTAMLVRINELEAALEALQKSNRREFGKLWKQQQAPLELNGIDDGSTGNDELDAFLELQRSHGSK
jgi:hypothetical protein